MVVYSCFLAFTLGARAKFSLDLRRWAVGARRPFGYVFITSELDHPAAAGRAFSAFSTCDVSEQLS